MEKSWNMINHKIPLHFVISHGILPILPKDLIKLVPFLFPALRHFAFSDIFVNTSWYVYKSINVHELSLQRFLTFLVLTMTECHTFDYIYK